MTSSEWLSENKRQCLLGRTERKKPSGTVCVNVNSIAAAEVNMEVSLKKLETELLYGPPITLGYIPGGF